MASDNATISPGQADGVDQEKVNAYQKSQLNGPEVGRGFVTDRETGQKVPVSVRVLKDGPNLEYSIADPDGRKIGKSVMKDYTEADPDDGAYPGTQAPEGFKPPSQPREGMEDKDSEAGRGFGNLKANIDKNYEKLQAEQAARNAGKAGKTSPVGGKSIGKLGGSSPGGSKMGGSPSAGAPSGGGVKPSVGGGAKSGAAEKLGGGGKPGGKNIRGAVDQAKGEINKLGDQTGGKTGNALGKVTGAVDKAEQVVDKTATGLMVLIYVLLSWLAFIGSITFLFSTGFLGALVCIFPLLSPKYAYKVIVWILSVFAVGRAIDMAVDANNIKLNGTEQFILIINTILVLGAWVVVFGGIIVLMIYGVCKPLTSGLIGGAVTVGVTVTDYVGVTNLGPALDFCKKFTSGIDALLGGISGNSNLPAGGGSKSIEQYAPLLHQIAKDNNVDYCALEALMRKESGGDRYAYSTVYYPGAKVGPSGSINPSNSPPYYGLSFTGQGHAIGLLQIFVYNDGKEWQDKNTPSRNGQGFGFPGKYLTIQDLIDENTNIKAGTGYYINLLKQYTDPALAYAHYQGNPDKVDPATLTRFTEYYKTCKTR